MKTEGCPDMLRRLRRAAWDNRWLVIAAACLLVFGALMADVLKGEGMRIDAAARAVFVDRLRNDALTPYMEAFSALGTVPVLVAIVLVIIAFAPGKRPGWCCAVNLALTALLNVVLKMIVQRPRPEGIRLVVETGFSFPSGHSMVAMSFFGLIVWFIWRYERDGRLRLLLTAAFGFIILMIGISRIYLGVHYASDVLGGFCASVVWLVVYTRFAGTFFMGAKEGGGHPVA